MGSCPELKEEIDPIWVNKILVELSYHYIIQNFSNKLRGNETTLRQRSSYRVT